MIKDVLVPLDFSHCSLYAIQLASDITSKTLGIIHILYVLEGNCGHSNASEIVFSKIKNLISIYETENPQLNFTIKISCNPSVVSEILSYERNTNIDLIIMGGYGSDGLNPNSISTKSIRTKKLSKTPVIIIKSPELEKKHKTTSNHNEYLKRINTIIKENNRKIKQKSLEISDSIEYTKRLQDAILPPIQLIKKYHPNTFILSIPKDIVSGDFYWFEHLNNTSYIAVADSTGHGVPGAMVSIVCSNALNRSLFEYRNKQPASILNQSKKIISSTFTKNNPSVKDGMDIALCTIKQNQLTYSGANNPLWIVRDNNLIELKANRQSVSSGDVTTAFTNHTIELKKNDMIYLFTDGYIDQFGGDRGKKYKTKKFKQLLLNISSLDVNEQKTKLNKEFEEWKGLLEQTDDVCIMGIRI